MQTYKVIASRDEVYFEHYLNNPPSGYELHSWNMANGQTNYSQYVIVYKLINTGEVPACL